MSEANVDARLAALESKLGRLEQLLAAVNDKLDRAAPSVDETRRGIQAWVTEYVSLRLQQLVPETCEHPEREGDAIVAEGPVLPGTRIRCTDEVLHRLGRIPIDDALDLHAFAPRDVASVVAEYLEAARAKGFTEVRLIHGRGIGVQRKIVQAVLARHPVVAGFADAPPERGGAGATIVRLRPI